MLHNTLVLHNRANYRNNMSIRLTEKVKALKTTHKASSQRWLLRHLNDPFVRQARQEGWRCRSALKLIELNTAHHILRPGMNVLDLGCAPGGWSQVAQHCLQSSGVIISVDRLAMDPIPHVTFHQGDILDPAMLDTLRSHSFHCILSDMAPSNTGHKATDRFQMETLLDMVWEVAQYTLAEGGSLVAKMFHGQESFVKNIQKFFTSVRYVKPCASRAASKETYFVAKGYRCHLS